MYITKIIYQKKTKEYSVHFDQESPILIKENSLVKFQLFKGKEIKKDQIAKILYQNQVYLATELALKYLRKLRSKKEIYDFLKENNIDDDIIYEVIKYLESYKYVNDQEYSLSFVKDKLNINRYGPEKIIYLLKTKGIDSETINLTFEKIDQSLIKENFLKDGSIKYKKVKSSKNAYEKTVKFLLSKGYKLDYILKNIKDIIS